MADTRDFYGTFPLGRMLPAQINCGSKIRTEDMGGRKGKEHHTSVSGEWDSVLMVVLKFVVPLLGDVYIIEKKKDKTEHYVSKYLRS
jgi:hypothetical protein